MNFLGALGAENEAALARLKKALVAQPGFQLILLEVPEGSTRDHVLGLVMAWSGREGVPRLRRMRARGRAEVVPRLVSRQGGIVLEDIDSALLDDAAVDRLVGALNWQRDQLRKRIAGPLLLVISARGVARLFERAPDLATWRSHTCRITASASEASLDRRLFQRLLENDGDPLELDRIEESLESAMQRGAPADLIADAWIQAGNARERGGDHDQARKAYNQAAGTATCDADQHSWALLKLALLDLRDHQIADAERRMKSIEPRLVGSQNPALQGTWLSLRAMIAGAKGDGFREVALWREAVAATHQREDLRGPALLGLAAALRAHGEVEAAMTILKELDVAGNEPAVQARAYMLAAEIERERDRPDRAMALLKKGIALAAVTPELRVEHVSMTLGLARLLLIIGQHAAARKTLKGIQPQLSEASAAVKDEAATIDGMAAMAMGEASSVATLERAAKHAHGARNESHAQFGLALARANFGDLDGARRAAEIGARLARNHKQEDVISQFQPIYDALFPPAPTGARRAKASHAAAALHARRTAQRR